ncbi:transcription elongation factor GreA [candidate division LCP-89 bacterium B3_LCP]|uniref:Transcription elongation factor GreA n=1 Tax=candidate division LCP-89 bacterium B3_LCP TaxID=2012998 RepID=A0A532UVV7_UNCL8|nr:MAG: transcription elongation factor GreA [candidate division LCP-89 bacterium B3_LCP]
MGKFIYMSREGIDKVKRELKQLLKVEQPRISKKLASAREHGDLSENAEYDAAREEMEHMQRRIGRLQETLARAQIFDPKNIDPDEVTLLATVELQDLKKKKNITYKLVSAEEVDVERNMISIESPVGRALVGKRVDEIVTIKVPVGTLEYKILSVSRD